LYFIKVLRAAIAKLLPSVSEFNKLISAVGVVGAIGIMNTVNIVGVVNAM
jgi:hypothetical protein